MKVAGKRSWLRWILLTLLLSAVLTVGSWLAYVGSVLYVYNYRPSYRIAEYDGFYASLAVDGDRIVDVAAGTERAGNVLPNMFIRKDASQPVALAELPEQWIADVAAAQDWSVNDSANGRLYVSGSVSTCSYKFLDGRLIYMHISTLETPFQIGPTPDGPFISLPVPVEEFLAIFGEPKKWTKGRHARPAGLP